MRVALAEELGGIDSVELGERPDPAPATGQALVRVHGAGAGPWDVGFLSGGFPGPALPFVQGQEVAGVVEAVGDGVGVQPGERVYASLFPAGDGFAELALASADRLAPMPGQARSVARPGRKGTNAGHGDAEHRREPAGRCPDTSARPWHRAPGPPGSDPYRPASSSRPGPSAAR